MQSKEERKENVRRERVAKNKNINMQQKGNQRETQRERNRL